MSIRFLLVFLVGVLSSLNAIGSGEFIEKKIVDMSKSELTLFFNGEKKDVMVKFTRGDKFPFEILLSGGIFSLSKDSSNPYYLTVENDFYLRFPQKSLFLVSYDGEDWKSFMEAITGSVFANLNRSDVTGELSSTLSIELNQR